MGCFARSPFGLAALRRGEICESRGASTAIDACHCVVARPKPAASFTNLQMQIGLIHEQLFSKAKGSFSSSGACASGKKAVCGGCLAVQTLWSGCGTACTPPLQLRQLSESKTFHDGDDGKIFHSQPRTGIPQKAHPRYSDRLLTPSAVRMPPFQVHICEPINEDIFLQ